MSKSTEGRTATLLVHGEEVPVTWAELDQVNRLAFDEPPAALALGEQWLNERNPEATR